MGINKFGLSVTSFYLFFFFKELGKFLSIGRDKWIKQELFLC